MPTFTEVDHDPFALASPGAAPATRAPAVNASPLDRALAAENTPAPVAAIARSVFQQETSSGKNVKTSNAGAVGPMQVIPSTFKSVADQGWDINNPEHNARAGVRYISQMYDKAGGDPALTAAGYYGGPGGLEKARQGVAVSDPRNPTAPNTLQYGQQVAARIPKTAGPTFTEVDHDPFAQPVAAPEAQGQPVAAATPAPPKPTGLSMTTDINGNPLPQRTVSFLQGVMDPVAAASQLIDKALPTGAIAGAANWLSDKTGGILPRAPEGGFDNAVKQREQAYEQARTANGETGIDGYRALGNILSPVNAVAAARVPQAASLIGRVGLGAASGAASGALTPVASDDFWTDKAQQVGTGAAVGGAVPVAAGAISRLISPAASTNADLALLKSEGVRPTIGQSLGGWANRMEEKLQSVPILGDGIAAARGRAREDFNKAAINRTLAPIGEKVDSVGHAGVREAGDKLSNAYDNLLSTMSLRPDQQLATDLSGIAASRNLRPQEADMFNALMRQHAAGFGQGGTMSGKDFKVLESTLNNEAKNFSGSADGYQKLLGGALEDALGSFRGALQRANPNQAPLLKQINEGWANLVRVEGAAKSGINAKGVFTPAQLNGAVRGADRSVRDRATSRGEALMQDLGDAGQTMLGNKVPDSGTAGRLMGGIGALATGAVSPAIPAALIGGAAMYTRPMQALLSGAVSARPAAAQPLADTVRRLSPGAAPLLAPAMVGVPNDRKDKQKGFADGGIIPGDDIAEQFGLQTRKENQQADDQRQMNADQAAGTQYSAGVATQQGQAQAFGATAAASSVARTNEAIGLQDIGEGTDALGYDNPHGYANGGLIDSDPYGVSPGMDASPGISVPNDVPDIPTIARQAAAPVTPNALNSSPATSIMRNSSGIDAGSTVQGLFADSAFNQGGSRRIARSFKNGGMIGAPEMQGAIKALAFGRSKRT